MNVNEAIQYIVAGIATGAVYAIIALGMTVVLNATDTINVAHGGYVVLGGAFTITYKDLGLPTIPAACLAVATVGVVSVVQAVLVVMPMIRANATPLGLLIGSVGVAIALQEVIGIAWGKSPLFFESPLGIKPVHVGEVTIQKQAIAILLVGAVVVVMLFVFFRRSRTGQSMLACSVDRVAAGVLGIDTRRVAILAFLISGLLAGLAGVFVTPISAVSYTQGDSLILLGFTAAAVGGLGNPVGAVLGGLVIGVLESLAGAYISSAWKDFIALGLLLVVLMARPTGLLRGLRAATG
jgi:branched-chain amino acid transport system permease protein